MKPIRSLLFAFAVTCVATAQSPLPTANKYIDGTVTLIGFDSADKERVVKIAWEDLRNAKPIPGGPKAFREEIDLSGFSDSSQRSLIAAVNKHGYFAAGLSAKHTWHKQTYDVFEIANNAHTLVGTASPVQVSID